MERLEISLITVSSATLMQGTRQPDANGFRINRVAGPSYPANDAVFVIPRIRRWRRRPFIWMLLEYAGLASRAGRVAIRANQVWFDSSRRNRREGDRSTATDIEQTAVRA